MDRSHAQASPDDIDISDLWRSVVRARWPLAIMVLLAGAATFLFASQLTPRYKSESQLLLETPEAAFTKPRGQEQLVDGQKLDQEMLASQVQVIASRDLLAKVAKSLELERNPEFNEALKAPGIFDQLAGLIGIGSVDLRRPEEERVLDALSERLVVYPISKTYVIVVEMAASDPDLAAKIANAVADGYLEFTELGRLREGSDAVSWLGGQLDALKRDASGAETALERFRAEAGLLSGQNNVTLNSQQLSEINSQLSQAKAQKSDADARVRLIRELMETGDLSGSPEIAKSALMQRLTEQKSLLDRQIAELSATLLPKHPRMRQLNSELASLNKQIRVEAGNIVRAIEGEAEVASARQAALEESLAQLSKVAGNSSEAQAQLRVLGREATSKRELYETFLNRFNDASTCRDRLAVPATAKVIARARPASDPDFPKKLPLTMLSMAATLLVGLGFVVSRALVIGARGGLAHPVVMRAPVAQATINAAPHQAPAVVGVADPAFDPQQRRDRAGSLPVDAFGSEPARAIRFQHPSGLAKYLAMRGTSQVGFRTLMTSEGDNPALARTAVELARELAKTGAQVILIDWIFDGPIGSGLMDLRRQPGMADLIGDLATFETVVQRDPASTLQVIAGGATAPSLDGDHQDHLRLVFDALDETYQHIVVVARRREAEGVLEAVEGHFDAGILLTPGPGLPSHDAGGFIGYEVPGMDMIRLEGRRDAPVQPGFRRTGAPRLAVAGR